MSASSKAGRRQCVADVNCPMTGGYYIGAGMWICWAHALFTPGVAIAVANQELQALPVARAECRQGEEHSK